MIGSLGQILVGVADSVMVGQLGTIPLAAVSFANSLLALPLVFGYGIAYGLTPLIANAEGEGNLKKAVRYFKNGIVVNTAMGLLISLSVAIIAQFSGYFGQDPQVSETAYSYLMVTGISLFPTMIFFAYKQFTEGLSDTQTAMRISLGANVLNIILNYAFIFGKLGFPEMGMVGAAWATLISRIVMLLGMMAYVHLRKKYVEMLHNFNRVKLKWKHMKAILVLGIPSGLQYIFEVGAFASASMIAGVIGAQEQAAHQIAITLASISYMAASGLGAAATIRVSNQLGRKDLPTLKLAAKTLFQMTIVFMSITGIFYFAFRNILPTIYTDDVFVIGIAAELLIVTTVFQISDGIQVTALGALRGLSDVRIPTAITFIAYFLFAIPLAWLLGVTLGFGALGVWIALAAALTLSATLLYIRFKVLLKKQDLLQTLKLSDL